jgi:anti-sigma B factor antagonist
MTPESLLEPSVTFDGETLHLSGTVTYRTVEKVWKDGLVKIKGGLNKLLVDLGGLTQCDSSGLALCVAWGREAHAQKKNIDFINVPVFVQDLVRVYGLDKVLSIKPISRSNNKN